jgi:hypothetical protein
MRPRFASIAILAMSATTFVLADHHEWIALFDGRTLMGWEANSENPTSFSVEDGAIKVSGERCHLFYVGHVKDAKFKDFELKAKVKTMPGANAGIYFHTKFQDEGWPAAGYEAQVNTTHSDWRKTGSLYAVDDVDADKLKTAKVKDGEWFDYYIRVQGNRVTIKINDVQLVDYEQPERPEHAKQSPGRFLGEGTFCLQAHDPGSTVYFKDIFVHPLN